MNGFGGGYGSITGYAHASFGLIQYVSVINELLSAPDSTLHSHTAESIALSQAYILALANATHSHVADVVNILQQHSLVVANASNSLSSDTIVLVESLLIAVQNASHQLASDGINIAQAHNLVIAGAIHTLASDGLLTLAQLQLLAIASAAHGHTASGNLSLEQYFLLNKPHDSIHSLLSTQIQLSEDQTITLEDALHLVTDNSERIIDWATYKKYRGNYGEEGIASGDLENATIGYGVIGQAIVESGILEQIDSYRGNYIEKKPETGSFK